jgi:Flp pilus assembly protein TadD
VLFPAGTATYLSRSPGRLRRDKVKATKNAHLRQKTLTLEKGQPAGQDRVVLQPAADIPLPRKQLRGSLGAAMRLNMRRMSVGAKRSALLAFYVFVLAGCEQVPALDIDPFNINGREGARPVDYETLMRLGASVHGGGDLANAVAIYRRAAAINPNAAAPFDGAGDSLIEMGQIDEAIVAYKSALERDQHDREALRGLGKAYLKTGRPELAGVPLALAYHDTPDDPKLLQLVGVTDDFLGQHAEAQARYRQGLELLPNDPALTVNLALSLALTGDYPRAIALLRPLALAPTATQRDRQTLALVYGLAGDRAAAEKIALLDLDPASVQHNLAFYERLRALSPEARGRTLQSLRNTTPAASH